MPPKLRQPLPTMPQLEHFTPLFQAHTFPAYPPLLRLALEKNRTRVAILDPKQHRCLFIGYTTSSTLQDILQHVAQTPVYHNWLRIEVQLSSPGFTLLPPRTYTKQALSQLLQPTVNWLPTDVLHQRILNHWDITFAFSAPPLPDTYTSSPIQYHHQGIALLEHWGTTLPTYLTYIRLFFDTQYLYIQLVRAQKLHFYNQFKASSAAIALKYLTIVLQVLHIDAQHIPIFCSCTSNMAKTFFKLAKAYYPQLYFKQEPSFFQAPYALLQHLKIPYLDLLAPPLPPPLEQPEDHVEQIFWTNSSKNLDKNS